MYALHFLVVVVVVVVACACVYVLLEISPLVWLKESTTFITQISYHVCFCFSVNFFFFEGQSRSLLLICLFVLLFCSCSIDHLFFLSSFPMFFLLPLLEIHLNLNVDNIQCTVLLKVSLQCSNLFNEINTIVFADLEIP